MILIVKSLPVEYTTLYKYADGQNICGKATEAHRFHIHLRGYKRSNLQDDLSYM